MAWIEVHDTLPSNKKIMRLRRALGISLNEAMGMLLSLWLWSLNNAEDGTLHDIEPADLAEILHFEGDPSQLVDALVGAGLLDRGTDELRIHDWEMYVGRLLAKRKQNAERMRRARRAENPEPPDDQSQSRARASHVHRTSRARAGATVPNRTVPNRTEPSVGIGDVVEGGPGGAAATAPSRPLLDHPLHGDGPEDLPDPIFHEVAETIGVLGHPAAERALLDSLRDYDGQPCADGTTLKATRESKLWAAKLGDERDTPGKRATSFDEWLRRRLVEVIEGPSSAKPLRGRPHVDGIDGWRPEAIRESMEQWERDKARRHAERDAAAGAGQVSA